MNRKDLEERVRNYTSDLTDSIFRQRDITNYLDEAIDRIKSRIPVLGGMVYLRNDESVPKLLPSQFHYLIAVYASSRAFTQDERHYQATTLMNEFEVKLDELIGMIDEGIIEIVDEDGNVIESPYTTDYVRLEYF